MLGPHIPFECGFLSEIIQKLKKLKQIPNLSSLKIHTRYPRQTNKKNTQIK